MRKDKRYNGETSSEFTEKLSLVNIRYEIDGLHFDAAVDINWELHIYDEEQYEKENWQNNTAIEIYCFDKPNWDVKMIYQKAKNNIVHTIVDFQNLIEETKNWIKEMS